MLMATVIKQALGTFSDENGNRCIICVQQSPGVSEILTTVVCKMNSVEDRYVNAKLHNYYLVIFI